MYTFITEDNHEYKKAKRINKTAGDDKLKYGDYKNVLFNRYKMNTIKSKDHNIESYIINKVCLLSYGDNKYLLEDGYGKLSHFQKSTR